MPNHKITLKLDNKSSRNKNQRSLNQIVKQIDQIKYKLQKIKNTDNYYPSKKVQTNQKKSTHVPSPNHRISTQKDSDIKSPNKMGKSNSVYEPWEHKTNKSTINYCMQNKHKSKSKWKKINQQLQTLAEININLLRENQILEHKLFCEKSQKKQLKKLLQAYNKQNAVKQIMVNPSYVSQHHPIDLYNSIDFDDLNSRAGLYRTRVRRKQLSQAKQNYQIIHDKKSKQLSINLSKMTQIKNKPNNIKSSLSDYNSMTLNEHTNNFNLKPSQIRQLTFKQQENSISQKNQNESLLLQNIQPQFGNSIQINNLNRKKNLEKDKSFQNEQKLKILEQQFNQLIGLSRLQQNRQKKQSIRKQLSQIANQIKVLKNGK